MRKGICIILAIMTAMLLMTGAFADSSVRRSVSYPGESFTFAIPAEYECFYKKDFGFVVALYEGKRAAYTAYVRLYVLPSDAKFNAASYLESEVKGTDQAHYRSTKNLLDEGKVKTYTVSGRKMTGLLYTYDIAGETKCTWELIDQWNGKNLRYSVRFYEDDQDRSLLLLTEMVRTVTGSGAVPKVMPGTLNTVTCKELNFTTKVKASYPTKYTKADGLSIYTKKEGVIPFITIIRSNDQIAEPYEFLREQYTPYMKEQYGKDLITTTEQEKMVIGGKTLAGAHYVYRLQGYYVHMLRLMDVSLKGTVVYTAKYLEGQGSETMAALDAAIANFKSTK